MLETGENQKCLETRENEKCLEIGKIQHFSLRAERRRREARRQKFTRENLTLPMLHLGPAVSKGFCRLPLKISLAAAKSV